MYLLCCGLINILAGLFDFLPALGNGGRDIFNDSWLLAGFLFDCLFAFFQFLLSLLFHLSSSLLDILFGALCFCFEVSGGCFFFVECFSCQWHGGSCGLGDIFSC